MSKRKYAVLFGYNGLGYQGLQQNPGAKTIEAELIDALFKVGGITIDIKENISKSGWSRAARTDKGVHALGQVVGVKLRFPPAMIDNLADVVTQLNNFLPSQIRVYDIIPVTRSFHAQHQCTGRRYQYLIPTFMFAPQPDVWKTVDTTAEQLKKDDPTLTRLSDGLLGEALSKTVDDTVDEFDSRRAPPLETDERVEWLHRRRTILSQRFTFDAKMLEKLNQSLAMYVGTRNYHNFTPRLKPNDPSCRRYITKFVATEPEMIGDLSVVRVTVEGQSFLLNQIRKMVGFAIEVTRRDLNPDIMLDAFSKTKMDVPTAPAAGLLLDAPMYKNYNEKFASSHKPVDFDSDICTKNKHSLVHDLVYPTIMSEELNNAVFSSYSVVRDLRVFPNTFGLTPVRDTRPDNNVFSQPSKRQRLNQARQLEWLEKKEISALSSAEKSNLKVLHAIREVEQFERPMYSNMTPEEVAAMQNWIEKQPDTVGVVADAKGDVDDAKGDVDGAKGDVAETEGVVAADMEVDPQDVVADAKGVC